MKRLRKLSRSAQSQSLAPGYPSLTWVCFAISVALSHGTRIICWSGLEFGEEKAVGEDCVWGCSRRWSITNRRSTTLTFGGSARLSSYNTGSCCLSKSSWRLRWWDLRSILAGRCRVKFWYREDTEGCCHRNRAEKAEKTLVETHGRQWSGI
jgi:hypothetical protein